MNAISRKPIAVNWLIMLVALSGVATNVVGQTVLDRYIAEGLKNNRVLLQKTISLDQANNALKVSRSYFLPAVNLVGEYTSGEGGRSINLPLGDLLNPVYRSLNELTGSDNFPQVPNVQQTFFPYNFYDAKLRATVPILNTDLTHGYRIKGQQVILSQLELEMYKRQLVYEIKASYFQYIAALARVKIYRSAVTLVSKHVEINESLVKNGKILPAYLLRSKAELENVKAELTTAVSNVSNARRYFNFLINRDLEGEIDITEVPIEIPVLDTSARAPLVREELQMTKVSIDINRSLLHMTRLNRLPKIHGFLDLGSQASDWQYNSDSRYYLFGVQLSLPLFQGFRNDLNIQQNRLALQKAKIEFENMNDQLQLAVRTANDDLSRSVQNFVAAREQLRSAKSYFDLIDKGYQQGVHTLIEFLDARNQLTTSELQLNLRSFEMLSANAKLERETASYPLEP
jgi:outer membrane protein